MPVRIQRRRTPGWRMPEGAVYVGRPTVFGNPFEVYLTDCCQYWDIRDDNGVTGYLVNHVAAHLSRAMTHPRTTPWPRSAAAARAAELYRSDLLSWGRLEGNPELAAAIRNLEGKDLACWCPLDHPCHADVLLDLANSGGEA